MYVPFENLKPTSRIWIYQSNRKFNPGEETAISEKGKQFVEQWTAHNNNLHASLQILRHFFIVIAVDESVHGASGCSIDKAFAFIQQLEKEFSVSLLDRKAVAYEKDGQIMISGLNHFEDQIKKGIVDEQTFVFNNLASTMAELENSWKIPLRDSWMMQLKKV